MQVLTQSAHSFDSELSADFLNLLHDIASNVQFDSNFRITHPDYKPFELPPEAIDRFQRVPPDLQTKYLSQQLRSFLYGIYYNGSLRSALAPDTEDNPALYRNLENNSFMGVNLQFYQQLHESNQGEGYFDPGWVILREEEDSSLAVKKYELTLHIDRQTHLQPAEKTAEVGDRVAIKMPKNFVQNGFYMAVGNQGADSRQQLDAKQFPLPDNHLGVTVRVYFNLTSEGSLAVMSGLTQKLNQAKIPFTFKALYNPDDYGRHDSAVLYFQKSCYPAVEPILQSVYGENQVHFREEVPLFTKQIAPGLAIAEEPDQKFAEKESFGMNRCQIIANGLLIAQQQGNDSPTARINVILQHFDALGIHPHRLHLNASSEDIYTVICTR
jgi:hypothetical protein